MMINLDRLNMCIITTDTLYKIIDDPYVMSVVPYTDRKDLQCYSVKTVTGERYKVFTRGKVL